MGEEQSSGKADGSGQKAAGSGVVELSEARWEIENEPKEPVNRIRDGIPGLQRTRDTDWPDAPPGEHDQHKRPNER